MQEFFGVPGFLVPCVVFVCMEERAIYVVELSDDDRLYRLLKFVKTQIEPDIPKIREKEEALDAAKKSRNDLRNDLARRRLATKSVSDEWARHKARLADDLDAIAGERTEGDDRRCRRTAELLRRGEPLDTAELRRTIPPSCGWRHGASKKRQFSVESGG